MHIDSSHHLPGRGQDACHPGPELVERAAGAHGAQAAEHQLHLSGATPTPTQQIACTRSFGHSINVLPSLIETVSEFTSSAAEKLRHDNQR